MLRVEMIGNLTADPAQKATSTGKTVTTFTVAINDNDRTEFIMVNAWDALGESCKRYLAKGKKVFVEGKLRSHEYEKDGQKKTYYEVTAREVEFLTPKTEQKQEDAFQDITSEDCPF